MFFVLQGGPGRLRDIRRELGKVISGSHSQDLLGGMFPGKAFLLLTYKETFAHLSFLRRWKLFGCSEINGCACALDSPDT